MNNSKIYAVEMKSTGTGWEPAGSLDTATFDRSGHAVDCVGELRERSEYRRSEFRVVNTETGETVAGRDPVDGPGTLYRLQDGEKIRAATPAECAESEASGDDGAIEVMIGSYCVTCYVA